MSGTTATITFVFLLIAAIMLHEWGHFITARKFGMRADRFFLGFGPTLWSTRVGETEYGVKAIPAGGFVRIRGMSPTDERLQPVADAVFDHELVAEERRLTAAAEGIDVLDVPAVTAMTWARLESELSSRGTPAALRGSITNQARSVAGPDATHHDAREATADAIAELTSPDDDISSLRHRLTRGDEGRFFSDRPTWERAIVLSAGSFMHFVIAIVLLFAGLLFIPQVTGELSTTIGSLVPDAPATAAGLLPGDRLTAVGDVVSDDFTVLRDVIRTQAGNTVEVSFIRDGQPQTLAVTIEEFIDPETGEPAVDEETGTPIGILGFVPSPATEDLGVVQAFKETFVGPVSVPATTVGSVRALGGVFGPDGIGRLFGEVAGSTERAVDGGISLVGAGAVTGQGVQLYGIMFLIGMLVSINVFIGVFNMLPLPPLDGGHLAVLGIEKAVNVGRRVRGKAQDFSVDPRAVAAVALPVIIVFGTVALALVWLDITNPIRL